MKDFEQKVSDMLYKDCVADQEKIRQHVLMEAHGQTEKRSDHKKTGRHWRWAALPAAACLTFFVLVNSSMAFASAVNRVPVLGSVARVITFRAWDYEDDASDIHTEQPAVEGTGNADFETKINQIIEEKIAQLNEKAQADSAEYKENWVAMGNEESEFVPIRYTFDYETYYTSEERLSFLIRQQRTITTNSADMDTTLYYYNLDVTTGADLTLQELLGEDWKKTVAAEVDKQIRASGDERKIAYYQEFWVDKNVPIDDAQKFYLNSDGKVIAVFDEGWIAPYEDGPQIFSIA